MSSDAVRNRDIGDLVESSKGVLRSDPRCGGILLFGSTARGRHDEHSDLDLLVLYRDSVPEETLDLLHPSVSVSFYDEARLRALPRRSPLFAIHLAREGRALYDPQGKLSRVLRSVGPLTGKDAASLAAVTKRRLRNVFADPGYAPGDQISAGELYALAKQAALLISARRGSFLFDRRSAFEELGTWSRELRADLESVALLEPAWLAARPTYEGDWLGLGAKAEELIPSAVRVIDQVARVGS